MEWRKIIKLFVGKRFTSIFKCIMIPILNNLEGD